MLHLNCLGESVKTLRNRSKLIFSSGFGNHSKITLLYNVHSYLAANSIHKIK